jgi:transposase
MDVVIPNCAGLDVHKKFVVAARRWLDINGQIHTEIRRFSTMTRDLEAMAAWLVAAGCTDVVLESTGVYWRSCSSMVWCAAASFLTEISASCATWCAIARV